VKVVFFKELADQLNSTRYLILLILMLSVSLLICNTVSMNIAEALGRGTKIQFLFLKLFTVSGSFFSLKQFIAFFGPLLGIVMGFDAINREFRGRTLSKVLCQPIYRDDIINGKFLAGLATLTITLISLILLISGLGMASIGVVPTLEEIARLFIYLVFSVAYIGLWLGIAILFSIVFRSVGTSALASISLWIFVAFFVSFAANVVADIAVPRGGMQDAYYILKRQAITDVVSRLSPVTLYNEAALTILDPGQKSTRSVMLLGPMESVSMSRFKNPLPLHQSLVVVAPHLTMLFAMTFFCFGISYVVFMRQEIRAV